MSNQYVNEDKFKEVIEKVNSLLETQRELQNKYISYSVEYRDSLRKEIDLLEEKKQILKAQSENLLNEVRVNK